jgi:hypothetical protein
MINIPILQQIRNFERPVCKTNRFKNRSHMLKVPSCKTSTFQTSFFNRQPYRPSLQLCDCVKQLHLFSVHRHSSSFFLCVFRFIKAQRVRKYLITWSYRGNLHTKLKGYILSVAQGYLAWFNFHDMTFSENKDNMDTKNDYIEILHYNNMYTWLAKSIYRI